MELFSRLRAWDYLIISSNLNSNTGKPRAGDTNGFVTVPVLGYSSNGFSRILNWASYAISASLRGLRSGRVEVVYGSSPHLLTALSAWVLSVSKRATFVFEVRDLWPKVLVDMDRLSERSMLFRILTTLEQFLYHRAHTIVVMAQGTRTELLSRGIPDGKIVYIPNGADPEDFTPSAPRAYLRGRYGFSGVTAIYAGAHGPANGLHLLLDAARHVPDVDIVLVGGGVLKDELKSAAARQDLRNVRFLDPVPKTEIPDLLAAADIGLHVLADVELFRSAVSPNKLFDYMAAGLTVLTNCPGIVSDIVAEAEAGISVAPDELAEGLRQLTETPKGVREAMSIAARSWIREHQSRGAMAERLAGVLERSRT